MTMFKSLSFSYAPAGLKRLFAYSTRLDTPTDDYSFDEGEYRLGVSEGEANLVTSATGNADWHLPVLDLDVPHSVVPSSTAGHSHLYIDIPVKWEDYKALLKLLAKMGILEHGYVDVSINKGATMVRKPGVKKISRPFFDKAKSAITY